jgi:hypothetical protein
MNKVVNPVVDLDFEKQVKDFMKIDEEYSERNQFFKKEFVSLGEDYQKFTHKYRLLGIFADRNRFPHEIHVYK